MGKNSHLVAPFLLLYFKKWLSKTRRKHSVTKVGRTDLGNWLVLIDMYCLNLAFLFLPKQTENNNKKIDNCVTEWKPPCCSTGVYPKMSKTAVTRQAAAHQRRLWRMQHLNVHESHLKLCHLTPSHSVQILRRRMGTRGTCHSVVRRHLFGKTEMMTLPPLLLLVGPQQSLTTQMQQKSAAHWLQVTHRLQQQRLLSM